MNLEFAVDRLFQAGWLPGEDDSANYERLPDGRRYPSILAVQREFATAGLELSIKHNLMFSCYRATWAPLGEALDPGHAVDEVHGTVVGSCQTETAVYALALLRENQLERQLVGA